MKNAFARDFLTGLTTLAGIVGLVVTLWLFGELKDIGKRYYEFTLRLNAAGGLTNTSPVALNGVRIGAVRSISLATDAARGALVRLKIKEGTEIPEGFTVFLDKGFVGETTVQLEYTPGEAPAALVQPGAIYDRHATTLFETISAPLKEPLARIARAADGIEKLALTYGEVGNKIRDSLEPRSPAEVDAGKPANLQSTLARIDQTVASAGQWLGDGALREQAKSVVAKADGLMDRANEAAGSLTKAARNADEQVTKVGGKVAETADAAGETLRKLGDAADEIGRFTAAANSGEGTVGQLVHNPDLYNSLRDAAARLERLLVEMQVLIEKYRTEGIPLNL